MNVKTVFDFRMILDCEYNIEKRVNRIALQTEKLFPIMKANMQFNTMVIPFETRESYVVWVKDWKQLVKYLSAEQKEYQSRLACRSVLGSLNRTPRLTAEEISEIQKARSVNSRKLANLFFVRRIAKYIAAEQADERFNGKN